MMKLVADFEDAAKGDCDMPELSEADSIHEQARAAIARATGQGGEP